MNFKNAIPSFFLIVALQGFAQQTANLKVQVTDIETLQGTIRIGLYASEDEWLEKTFAGKSVEVVANTCEVVFDELPVGEYAISIYQDKNNNGKLDMTMGFIPKEKFAASNQAPAVFGPPKWERAKFTLSENFKVINIKL